MHRRFTQKTRNLDTRTWKPENSEFLWNFSESTEAKEREEPNDIADYPDKREGNTTRINVSFVSISKLKTGNFTSVTMQITQGFLGRG